MWADNAAPKMDALVTLVEALASKDTLAEETRSEIKMILGTRKNNRWADAEAENAKVKEAQAQAMQSSAPKKSSAIRIEVSFHLRNDKCSNDLITNENMIYFSLIQMMTELRQSLKNSRSHLLTKEN